MTGLIGYAVVALFFAVDSVLAGRPPLFTASLLGSALFPALRGTEAAAIAYNAVHLLTFVAAGVFMAWLAALAERAPQAWYPAALVLLFVGAHVLAVPIWFADDVSAALPLRVVAGVTIVAAAAMAAFLWRARPGLRAGAHEPY
jgi:hypothetical protein